MAGWARSHGAGPSVQTLCDRIINAQKDEINIMQTWLRDRGQPVPEAKPVPMKMMMDGMEHEMLMPGMLTGRPAQGARRRARPRVRQALSQGHDPAPPGRRVDGGRSALARRRPRRTSWCSSSVRDIHVDQIDRDRAHAANARADHAQSLGALSPARPNSVESPLTPTTVRHRSRSCSLSRLSPGRRATARRA